MLTLYGIHNCDTCKKARTWLGEHHIEHRFHDFRIDGLNESQIQGFIDKLGWEKLLNKSSTSWRNLSPEQQADLNEDIAIKLILATPTLIKRPLLDTGKEIILGFKPDSYQDKLL